jgi:putative membrane protein (TIGR04086 family)
MQAERNKGGFFSSIIRGTLFSVITALIGVLVFALVVKLLCLNSSAVKIVNQFLKVVSIFLGCVFSITESKGLIKGALIGGLSAIIIYLLFALIGGGVKFSGLIIIDVIFSVIVGGLMGIIAVNVKKR